MKVKRKSLKINGLLNLLKQTLNFIYPLITFPYVSRILSVESVGKYNFSSNYVNYFVLLASLGIATYAVREGSKYRGNEDQLNLFSSQLFSINVISTIIAYLILLLSLVMFKDLSRYALCILIFSIQIAFNTIGTEWIYIIFEEYGYITLRSILFKLASLVLLFLFVRNRNDYLNYAGITVFAVVGSNILNFIHVRSLANVKLTKQLNISKHFKPILILFLSSMAVTVYVSSDMTLLGIMKGTFDVGIYSVATKIYMVILQVIAAVLMVTIPRLSMLFGQSRMREYYQLLDYVIRTMTLIVIPSAIGVLVMAKEIIIIIGGEKYLPGVLALRVLTLAMLFSIFNTLMCNCILIPEKKENLILKANIVTAVLNILLNIVLIPFWSYNAAAITTVVAEAFTCSVSLALSMKRIKVVIGLGRLISNTYQVIIASIIVLVYCYLVKILTSELAQIVILSVMGSVIIYFTVLLSLKNKLILEFIKKGD